MLRLGAVVTFHLDDGGHADGVDLVLLRLLGDVSPSPSIAELSIRAADLHQIRALLLQNISVRTPTVIQFTHRGASGQAHINCSTEQHERALWELESSELGSEIVSITRGEIFEKIRIHRASDERINKNLTNISHVSPVDEDGLDLVAGVGDVHPSDREPVHVGADAVEVDLHVERGPGLHPELVIYQSPRLPHAHAEDGGGAIALDLLNLLDVVDNAVGRLSYFLLLLCCCADNSNVCNGP